MTKLMDIMDNYITIYMKCSPSAIGWSFLGAKGSKYGKSLVLSHHCRNKYTHILLYIGINLCFFILCVVQFIFVWLLLYFKFHFNISRYPSIYLLIIVSLYALFVLFTNMK